MPGSLAHAQLLVSGWQWSPRASSSHHVPALPQKMESGLPGLGLVDFQRASLSSPRALLVRKCGFLRLNSSDYDAAFLPLTEKIPGLSCVVRRWVGMCHAYTRQAGSEVPAAAKLHALVAPPDQEAVGNSGQEAACTFPLAAAPKHSDDPGM